ncbi:hypothetical protein MPTK2_3g06920 [Marchantia polymorpha subsp. ruderalis]
MNFWLPQQLQDGGNTSDLCILPSSRCISVDEWHLIMIDFGGHNLSLALCEVAIFFSELHFAIFTWSTWTNFRWRHNGLFHGYPK